MTLRTSLKNVWEWLRDDAWNEVIWLLLQLTRSECTLDEVRNRRYDIEKQSVPEIKEESLAKSLELAKDLYVEDQRRKDRLSDKTKGLVTVVGLLVPFTVAALLPRMTKPWLLAIPMACLLVSMVMLLTYLGVDLVSEPQFDKSLFPEGKLDEKELVKSYLVAREWNSKTADFLIGTYKAARRSLCLALMSIVVIGIVEAYETKPFDQEKKFIGDLRANPDLIELLRGPAGRAGSQGERGTPGATGVQGAKGDKGDAGPAGICDCSTPGINQSTHKREGKPMH